MPIESSQTVLAGLVVSALVIGAGLIVANTGKQKADMEEDSSVQQTLELESATSPDELRPTDALPLSITVTNEGASSITETFVVRVDKDGDGRYDTDVAKASATVPADRTTTIPLEVPPEVIHPGTVDYAVVTSTGDVLAADSADVLAPPQFGVETANTTLSVVKGQNASVTASVSNEGEYRGRTEVTHWVDADSDGNRDPSEANVSDTLSVGATTSEEITVDLPTSDLSPGRYDYRVDVGNETSAGTIVVLQPATFEVTALSNVNVTRGETANATLEVTNVGDVAGTATVSTSGPTVTENRTVQLAANESRNVSFSSATANLTRGNYTWTVETSDDNETVPVRIREPYFDIKDVRGNETITKGDPMVFTAEVVNTGDAAGTQRVELVVDIKGDDRPESHGITRNVTLAPGNRTNVTFNIDYMQADSPFNQHSSFPDGTAIYGFVTADETQTDVFVMEPATIYSGGGGTDSSSVSRATRNEITQEKFGLYYEELSPESQGQIDEVYLRQPFADGLVITDILTREQIARFRYGIDVDPGEQFEWEKFLSLDPEVQQQIEAEYDAQFTSEEGDRVESWDELAQSAYGTTYDQLNESQQQEIRDKYQEQFE